jgi:Cellulase (glycosyl hydrolase family 5)/F5/8 type C domain
MASKHARSGLAGILAGMVLLGACNFTPAGVPAPTAQITPIPSPSPVSPTQVPVPDHRIGVRVVDGVGEFYDRTTGEKFVPRGNNYVRLAPQQAPDGSTQVYHSVFDPGKYDPAAIADAFGQMQALGYNTVRVFVSQNTVGTNAGLNADTMQNVIDFLGLAKAHGLYVIITQDWLPGGPYGEILSQDCCQTFTMNNINFMAPAGLQANQAYFRDFVTYLMQHGAPMDAIFSFELRNELYFDMNFPPLSLDSGQVVALNGQSYDMSKPDDKTRMADENMVVWMDAITDAIHAVDPTALVSVGFFWPQEPHPARIGDPRYINTAPAIWQSKLDFVDLHVYPGSELTMAQYVDNFGINGMQAKPLLMGEFGMATGSASSAADAAASLMDWQVQSCDYGFDGWLLWSWDIYENHDFYSAQTDQGQIGQALAPINRPDPCQTATFDFIENNVALGKSVRASSALPGEPKENAVDGTPADWGAGASPPQWIQIDLGQATTVKEFRLVVQQTPNGSTVHRLYAGDQPDNLRLIHTFDGVTQDGQTLTFTPDQPLQGVRYVRVVTESSPSWVAWKEIEVIAAP